MKLSNLEKQRLLNKYGTWAVITGASSGIGLELARLLADSGFNLVLNARNEERLKGLQKEFVDRYKNEVRIIAGDVAGTEGIQAVKEQTINIDTGLFIPAAGYGTSGLFHESDIEDEAQMIRVNCEAVVKLTYHFANIFKVKGKGGIILFSSLVAFQGVPYSANYAATKAYIQSLAEGLYHELRPFNVDVLSAAPGPVQSGFGKRANMQMDMYLTPEQVGIPILKALGRQTTILPGFLTKFLVYSLRTVPRWGKVRVMKLVMGGMTKHQRAA